MAKYPGSETERRVRHAVLHDVVARVFAACGMAADDAAVLAQTLVLADLRAIHSHGVMRVPDSSPS